MSVHLDPSDLPSLAHALKHLLPHAPTSVDRAGEGNMNLTLRVTLEDGSTCIVKQARPWVEKYPQIAAPDGRALVEAAFYEAVRGGPPASAMPALLATDSDQRILVFQDLGPSADYADCYAGGEFPLDDLELLLTWLEGLHALKPPATPLLANREMRALNHEHIFVLPFREDNGLDLDAILPGVADLARRVREHAGIHAVLETMAARYLADGTTLLHGDFYPGSFLRTPSGPMVIDPEFAFLGDPAFDRGVLAGHMVLAGQGAAHVGRCLAGAPTGSRAFAAIEILRRLLGVAQLPLEADLRSRTDMVDTALAWLDA